MIAAVSILAVAGSARAQQATQPPPTTSVFDQGSWTVTPFLGFGFSGDLDSPTPALGIAGGYLWNSRVALEGEWTVLPASEANGIVEVDSESWSITGNFLYHFAGRTYVPYGVIGMGAGHGTVDEPLTDPLLKSLSTSSTTFVVNVGGGIERKLRNRLAIRADFRYFFAGDLVPDYWRASAGVTYALHLS